MYDLIFDLSSDPVNDGDTSTIAIDIVVNGAVTALGAVTSPPGNSNTNFNWGINTIDVTATFDPTAAELYFRWKYSSGPDTAHVRRLRVRDTVSGQVWNDQYRGLELPITLWQVAANSSGSSAQQLLPCNPSSNSGKTIFTDGFAHHIILPPTGCWQIGSVGFMPAMVRF